MGTDTDLVFQSAVEGLFVTGLKGRITPELDAKLRAAGLDLSKPLEPAYPRARWNTFIRVAIATLYAGELEATSYRALGRQLVDGYSEGILGKAIVGVLRLIGPGRTLERMSRNLRSGSNYNVCETRSLGDRDVLFWINEPDIPLHFSMGMIERAMEFSGARGLVLTPEKQDAEGCSFRVRWDP